MAATFGVIYALESSRLIMDHMAKEPFEVAWWPLVLMAALILNSRLQVANPAVAAWAALAVTLAGYLHYTVHVVNEICAYLGINCLTIKHPHGE